MELLEERVYISGPISGTDDYLERFARVEERIKARDWVAVNPAKVNASLPKDTSYACYIDTSLAMLRHCTMIWMMKGWKDSKGALLEYAYARALDIAVIDEEGE